MIHCRRHVRWLAFRNVLGSPRSVLMVMRVEAFGRGALIRIAIDFDLIGVQHLGREDMGIGGIFLGAVGTLSEPSLKTSKHESYTWFIVLD